MISVLSIYKDINGVEEDPEGVEGPAEGPAHFLQRRWFAL